MSDQSNLAMNTLLQCEKCKREEWVDTFTDIICCGERMKAIGGIIDRPILAVIGE